MKLNQCSDNKVKSVTNLNKDFNLKEMSINELSEFISFNPSKIRYYESELSIPIERDSRGRRKYTENTIKIFLRIKSLLKAGKKLEELKPLLKEEIELFTLSNLSSSKQENSPDIEIIKDENIQDFDLDKTSLALVTRPFEVQIKQQQDRIERLLDRIEVLQDEKVKLKEDFTMKQAEFIATSKFQEIQLAEYKKQIENLKSKKWWQFWLDIS